MSKPTPVTRFLDQPFALRSIHTRYVGATNTKPARISAKADDLPAVYVSYDDEFSPLINHKIAAAKFVQALGWTGHYVAGADKSGYTFVNIGTAADIGKMLANG